MHNQRYQSIRTFSVSLLVMSLFLVGANMVKPTPVAAQFAADLKASTSVEVDGSTATYTIMVENLGPHSTAKVQVTDHLPECLEFVSSEADRGSYDADTWIWEIGALKVGEVVTLTIKTTITDACPDTVTNRVEVKSSLPDRRSDFFNLFDDSPPTLLNNRAEVRFGADMNDRFATEKTGANGFVRVNLTQGGGIEIDRVSADGLLPNQAYLLAVTICPIDLTDCFPLGDATLPPDFLHTIKGETDNDGRFHIDDFYLGDLPDGNYRVDIFVTHDPASGEGSEGAGVFLTGLLGGEPLLACQPAFRITVIRLADMNDRFANEKGATGSARVNLTQEGGIEIDRVSAENLAPDHSYLLTVTVTPPGGTFPADAAVFTHPVTSNLQGTFDHVKFDLGVFAPGIGYRVDVFVTHTHLPDTPRGPPFDIATEGRDPLLACQPAFFVEVITGSDMNPRFATEKGATGFVRVNLVEIDRDGTTFKLGRNYPNPFNPTTIVPFSLTEAAHVSIRVYDLLGREVSVLVDGQLSAGMHEVVFEANNLSTGVYLIRMEAAGRVQIQQLTLMK